MTSPKEAENLPKLNILSTARIAVCISKVAISLITHNIESLAYRHDAITYSLTQLQHIHTNGACRYLAIDTVEHNLCPECMPFWFDIM